MASLEKEIRQRDYTIEAMRQELEATAGQLSATRQDRGAEKKVCVGWCECVAGRGCNARCLSQMHTQKLMRQSPGADEGDS